MSVPRGEQLQRVSVLGQIAVMRRRLDRLEAALVDRPIGDMAMTEEIEDAINNIAFQAGALVAQLTRYKDAASSGTGKPNNTQRAYKEGQS